MGATAHRPPVRFTGNDYEAPEIYESWIAAEEEEEELPQKSSGLMYVVTFIVAFILGCLLHA